MQEENCGCIIRSVITTVILQCYLASKIELERGKPTIRSVSVCNFIVARVVRSGAWVFPIVGLRSSLLLAN